MTARKIDAARKLTIATVAGKASTWFEKLMATEGKKLALAKLYGAATGYVAGATEYGEFLKFRGTFRGINLQTGETTDAPVIILPPHLAESLRASLEMGAQRVDFAFEIVAEYDATAATKYVYRTASLLPPSESDPLAALEKSLGDVLALAAPAAAPAPALPPAAPAPAPAPAKSRK